MLGAHGTRHLMLPAQPIDVQARELADCKAELEQLLGERVSTVAYPYGGCDFATTEIAEQVGFTIGCSVEPDCVTPDSDPMRLPRLEVEAGDIDNFRFWLERAMAGPG